MTSTPLYRLVKTIAVPGAPLAKFDIGWVDDSLRSYYLADRSNARLIVADVDRLEYSHSLGTGEFTGAQTAPGMAGPNGVVVLPDVGQVWAGDGDSTVKVIDLASREVVDRVHTGGAKRVDELAYDPSDGIVLVGNDKEAVPFLTLISTSPSHEILRKIAIPYATRGLHQPVWDPAARMFCVPITEVNGDPSAGEIAIVDPVRGEVVSRHPVKDCQPAGLAFGPNSQLCIGCSQGAVKAGFAPRSLVMDVRTGTVAATIREVGGSDEVWYNPSSGHYYVAAAGMTGGPVLGVIDAQTMTWLESLQTCDDSRSVAADARTNRVFVPVTPGPSYPRGGIAVFEMQGYARGQIAL